MTRGRLCGSNLEVVVVEEEHDGSSNRNPHVGVDLTGDEDVLRRPF
jgi:hypothetical protein